MVVLPSLWCCRRVTWQASRVGGRRLGGARWRKWQLRRGFKQALFGWHCMRFGFWEEDLSAHTLGEELNSKADLLLEKLQGVLDSLETEVSGGASSAEDAEYEALFQALKGLVATKPANLLQESKFGRKSVGAAHLAPQSGKGQRPAQTSTAVAKGKGAGKAPGKAPRVGHCCSANPGQAGGANLPEQGQQGGRQAFRILRHWALGKPQLQGAGGCNLREAQGRCSFGGLT